MLTCARTLSRAHWARPAQAVGNVTYAVVRGAGHMVPGDQPTRAYDLITRFIGGTPF